MNDFEEIDVHRKFIIALMVLSQLVVGCATIITHQKHTAKSPTYIKYKNECSTYNEFGVKQQIHYSGTRFLVAWMNLPFACSGEDCFGRLIYPILLPLYLLDLPLSFIADTVLSIDTHKMQYIECEKYDFKALEKDRSIKVDLLFSRSNALYKNIHDLGSHMYISSSSKRSNIAKNDFMVSLENNPQENYDKYVFTDTRTSCVGEDQARIIMTNKNNPPMYFIDDWVYENSNWYLDAHTERNTNPIYGRNGGIVDICR